MTHLEFLTLFGSFTNGGYEKVSTDRREFAEGKLPDTTNTRIVIGNLTRKLVLIEI